MNTINFDLSSLTEAPKEKKWKPVKKPIAPIEPVSPGQKPYLSVFASSDQKHYYNTYVLPAWQKDYDDYIKKYNIWFDERIKYNEALDEWEKQVKPKKWAAKQTPQVKPSAPPSHYTLKDDEHNSNPILKKLELIWRENNKSLLFIRFTSAREHGIGINPNYSYDTPKGTYAYPFNPKWIEKIKNKKIPYAFNESGVIIFKWDPASTPKRSIVLDSNGNAMGYDKSAFAKDYKLLEELLMTEQEKKLQRKIKEIIDFNNKAKKEGLPFDSEKKLKDHIDLYRNSFQETVDDTLERGLKGSYKGTYFNKIYNLARLIADQDAAVWANILCNVLNISCIYDRDDSSTIHGNEPTQAVFFEPEKGGVLLNQENIFPNTKLLDYGEVSTKYYFVPADGNSLPPSLPPGKYFRIRARENIQGTHADIYKDQDGGFVSGPHNIAANDDCWIAYNAAVIGNAHISGKAFVGDSAVIKDNAKVTGRARVDSSACVYENAFVTDSAIVTDNTRVYGKAIIRDNAKLFDGTRVWDKAIVGGYTRLYGYSTVHGQAYLADLYHTQGKYDKDIYEPIPAVDINPAPKP